jgi:hypothetical protein
VNSSFREVGVSAQNLIECDEGTASYSTHASRACLLRPPTSFRSAGPINQGSEGRDQGAREIAPLVVSLNEAPNKFRLLIRPPDPPRASKSV